MVYMCVCAFMCVCLLLYKGTHVKLLIFYHKPVVVMKQLLFNLTRYACYLRRADMKKFSKLFFLFWFVFFFCLLVIASALEPVSALSFVSLSVRLLSGHILL